MWFILTILIFIVTIGVTIGGLLVAPKEQVRPVQLVLLTVCFTFLCYLGMITGMFLTGWISLWLLDYLVAVVALLFIVASMRRFHPTLGFFHPEDRIVVSLLALLFFLMGVEWGLIELRTFFTLFVSALFAAALILGVFIQIQIRQILWRYSYIAFTPLVWLLFVTVMKLL
ncbi:hypothetical protein [Halalkalibacter oceani]|uniref:Uncharacterized protein n=1 Tax=Halalkalibacter oceani TaxID=1653776 RepID=A0A9X2DLF5_9BACI|nr:hypothetical protein [Halalkalibacter oceani]MCM3712901.1 hypothetical protein [Halalkalibacter oceani]